jgi:integrase
LIFPVGVFVLTDAAIKRAKPSPTKVLKLWDDGGLFLAVMPTGSKLWRMKFRHGGKEGVLSFGPYPEVPLLRARELRDEARANLRRGIVPAGKRRAGAATPVNTPKPPTFEEVARRWHAQQAPMWKEHHAADVLARLEADVFPAFGAVAVAAVTSPQVLAAVRAIEPRSVDIARRVRRRISAIFALAVAEGLCIGDPAQAIVKAMAPLVKGQRPAIIDLAPARAVLAAVEAAPGHPITKLAHRLLALTAVRPGELRWGLWGEIEGIDGDAPLWRIPAARMKMGREHIVPLAAATVGVLAALRQLTGDSDLLFPMARDGRRPISENAIGYALNRAGYAGQHCPHGWRATFSSVMNERHRADRAVIELMLAHAPADPVEAAYHRALHMERRRELAAEWAGLILEGARPVREILDGPRR